MYPEWTNPLNNLRVAVEQLRDKEQRADLKAMANMYGLALEAQRRFPGRYILHRPSLALALTLTLAQTSTQTLTRNLTLNLT